VFGAWWQGTVKQVIPLEEHEGEPQCLSVSGQYLVCGTTNGFLKLWDTGRRWARYSCDHWCCKYSSYNSWLDL